VNSSRFDIAVELSSTIKIANRSKAMQSILVKEWITINQLELSEFYINQNRGRKKEREGIKYVVSGVGDFIKNSCVWELLSEPGLPDQSLCCQPSSEGVYDGRRKKDERRRREGRMDKDGSRKWWLEMKAARTSTMRTMVKRKGWKPRPYLLLFFQFIHMMHCTVLML